jgi:hypothetical protein
MSTLYDHTIDQKNGVGGADREIISAKVDLDVIIMGTKKMSPNVLPDTQPFLNVQYESGRYGRDNLSSTVEN